jgi:hypothetical protein
MSVLDMYFRHIQYVSNAGYIYHILFYLPKILMEHEGFIVLDIKFRRLLILFFLTSRRLLILMHAEVTEHP